MINVAKVNGIDQLKISYFQETNLRMKMLICYVCFVLFIYEVPCDYVSPQGFVVLFIYEVPCDYVSPQGFGSIVSEALGTEKKTHRQFIRELL